MYALIKQILNLKKNHKNTEKRNGLIDKSHRFTFYIQFGNVNRKAAWYFLFDIFY